MSILEIEAAISKLPADQIAKLAAWFESYQAQVLDKQIEDDLGSGRLASRISEAYASGEPSPLTKREIDDARREVKDRIAARISSK